ncbi:uncharacterized peptidase C1-like protein F26E4.3 [Portunus trituberculatus]|uniref:uncharacterized peptidase C1-like protein F26E4.3 n=1 Tax=Portunus trituberculatus TaxID=210409 RepID=UPI001E1CDD3B|nr:uncharacterized peptidase C1-like protein F26E4.3 [Portunus trituberculatus]
MTMASVGVLLVMVVAVITAVGADPFIPPRKDYCRNRLPSECCRDVRDDDCIVHIQDNGYCYCDDFCLDGENDHNDDCCPDFREVCLGEPKQVLYLIKDEEAVCIHNGKTLAAGKHTFNCNECSCEDGRLTCEEDQCLVDEELIRRMHQHPLRHGWTAANYSIFWGRKLKEGMELRTGTFLPEAMTYNMMPILLRPNPQRIPMEFDARQKWSGLISGVRDQGWCGASWAFSSLDVAQDREMILSGQPSIRLSVQELLSCTVPKMDCQGGYVEQAWGFLRRLGVMEETCYPYTSGQSENVSFCSRVSKHCKKYKTEPAYRISSKVEDIQWEILNNGPVQALMRVHSDLFLYKSGVYSCPQADDQRPTAMHSVRIVGWGAEYSSKYSPVKYWVVANSWGTTWGEKGFFRIQRGTNECGIETFVLAVRGTKDPMRKQAIKS